MVVAETGQKLTNPDQAKVLLAVQVTRVDLVVIPNGTNYSGQRKTFSTKVF
jgi:hypothetical protein